MEKNILKEMSGPDSISFDFLGCGSERVHDDYWYTSDTGLLGLRTHSHMYYCKKHVAVSPEKCWTVFQNINTALGELETEVIAVNDKLGVIKEQIVIAVNDKLGVIKKQVIEIINLCQQQGEFIRQFGSMVEAVDSLMRQQEELASLGEAQHALIKQRAEAVSALYEKMLELNEKLTATCLTEIENFRKKSEELQAKQQEESKRCIDDFLANKKQEFISETSRALADTANAEKNSFSSNIQQATQEYMQKMQADIDDYFNKKQAEFSSRYNSFGKRLLWLFTGK